ncbi:hypothetical protein [Rheinheimera sp.]|uniref:hypothetical protein n=1 Tax=Rheinheimera sp. TaxID=1869214 RepID=UPI00307E8B0C
MVDLSNFVEKFRLLHLAQRFYVLATLSLLLYLLSMAKASLLLQLFAVLLLAATAIEMWQRFAHWWHSLLGKALILVFYAIVLNFSFAYAESMVNSVLGIRPDVVPYTVNLAALLLAPAWALIGSMLVLQLYTTLHVSKVMLLLMLRPFGLRARHILPDEPYPGWTLCARIFYLPVVSMFLLMALASYFSGKPEELFSDDNTVLEMNTDQQSAKTAIAQRQEINVLGDEGPLLPTMLWLNKTLATFNYQIESLSASSCALTAPTHLVHINDFEVLRITPDPKAELGYRYEVALCQSPAFGHNKSNPKTAELP